MQTFDLTKESKTYLYGVSKISEMIAENLSQQNYAVEGFIDKRADEIQIFCNRRVYSLKFFEECNELDICVIICLQNGIQHDLAAQQLCELGICNIIFLPMLNGKTLEYRKIWREKYRLMKEKKYEQLRNIPILRKEYLGNIFEDNELIVISDEGDHVSFWCDIRDIYVTYYLIDGSLTNAIIDKKDVKYNNIRIEELAPYKELFKYLGSGKGDIEQYFELKEITEDKEKKEYISHRRVLYDIFENVFQYEPQFFQDSPVDCKWNEKGGFNVIDGLHRAHYLIYKGYRKIPIVVSKTDFNKYVIRDGEVL